MRTGFESSLGDVYNRPYIDDYMIFQAKGIDIKIAGMFPYWRGFLNFTEQQLWSIRRYNFFINKFL